MTPAISVRGLGKAYTIAHQEKATLASEALVSKLRNPFGTTTRETFWALKDVDFDIERGDVVGIIGRNGAGKSTLLKVLSRITTPTTGEVRIYGRVGSLLEVGTGFHPELTGRENIYLNGAILGMRKSEITRQFDAIVDFAEVEKFLDTPVKRYSSGMYVRLAFAVAAHLNPEILIVDEVLAVGDAQFQAKCLGKMQDVSRQQGKTVLFVSHNMATIAQLCRRCIVLGGGQVVFDGASDHGILAYNRLSSSGHRSRYTRLLFGDVYLRTPTTGVRMDAVDFAAPAELVVECRNESEPLRAHLVIELRSEDGHLVSSLNSLEEGESELEVRGQQSFVYQIPSMSVYPGVYTITAIIGSSYERYGEAIETCVFTVVPRNVKGSPVSYSGSHGVFRLADGVRCESELPIAR